MAAATAGTNWNIRDPESASRSQLNHVSLLFIHGLFVGYKLAFGSRRLRSPPAERYSPKGERTTGDCIDSEIFGGKAQDCIL